MCMRPRCTCVSVYVNVMTLCLHFTPHVWKCVHGIVGEDIDLESAELERSF